MTPACDPTVFILSGVSRSGKTTICQQAAELARRRGLVVAGILTLPGAAGGGDPAIDACDLRTGARARLAHYVERSDDPTIQHWQFCDDGLRLGSNALLRLPADLLIIDEIGPLELVHGRGWAMARHVLRQRAYRMALVAVRPGLHEQFLAWVDGLPTVTLPISRDAQAAAMSAIRAAIDAIADTPVADARGATDDSR